MGVIIKRLKDGSLVAVDEKTGKKVSDISSMGDEFINKKPAKS